MICFRRCVTDSFVLFRLWRKQTTAWVTCPAPLPTCWPSTWRKAGTWLSGIAVVSPAFPLASCRIHTALLSLVSAWQQAGCLSAVQQVVDLYLSSGSEHSEIGFIHLGYTGEGAALLLAVPPAWLCSCKAPSWLPLAPVPIQELQEIIFELNKKTKTETIWGFIKWWSCS